MKQVLRKGLKEVVVDEVPDPVPSAHHVLVRPARSLISAGTETASIHTEGLLRGVAENPSHIRTVLDAMKASMMKGERIELRGFGVFQVKPRKRGIGRNPRTGKEVKIPPGRTIRFKPGKDLQNLNI